MQAANSAGFCFGIDTILGLAAGDRLRPKRRNLAHMASRL
jgi:hypothetical protein